jgi:predicted Zn-dependent protease
MLMKAESQYRLDDSAAAVLVYQEALLNAEKITSNVTMRRFAPAYFRLAQILREQRSFDAALAAAESGLRLGPQDTMGQIFLGQLLVDSGQTNRALAHFRTQLASSVPIAEERAVLGMKADRLAIGQAGGSIAPPAFGSASLYAGRSIAIVPVNQPPAKVALADVCLFLEASWRLRCEVLPGLNIPEATMLNASRKQYNADVMAAEIERRLPRASRRASHVLAITDHDIYGGDAGFVFSWQQKNEANGVGVLSTSRIATDIPEFYEPEVIATRRIALQALSTTGSMLGFQRPTDPECPTAYPESVREFRQKRLRLCEAEEQQRDALVRRQGGEPVPFTPEFTQRIQQFYRRYFVE